MSDDVYDALKFRSIGLRGDRHGAHDAVVAQVQAEKANALSRAVEKLENAWNAAVGVRDEVRTGRSERADYASALEQSRRARWELRVHRDALGLGWHRDYDERWPALPTDPARSG